MKKIIHSKKFRFLVSQLRKAREESGLSQIMVAKMLKITQSRISKLESDRCKIDVVQLQRMARVYRKSIDFFLRT